MAIVRCRLSAAAIYNACGGFCHSTRVMFGIPTNLSDIAFESSIRWWPVVLERPLAIASSLQPGTARALSPELHHFRLAHLFMLHCDVSVGSTVLECVFAASIPHDSRPTQTGIARQPAGPSKLSGWLPVAHVALRDHEESKMTCRTAGINHAGMLAGGMARHHKRHTLANSNTTPQNPTVVARPRPAVRASEAPRATSFVAKREPGSTPT